MEYSDLVFDRVTFVCGGRKVREKWHILERERRFLVTMVDVSRKKMSKWEWKRHFSVYRRKKETVVSGGHRMLIEQILTMKEIHGEVGCLRSRLDGWCIFWIFLLIMDIAKISLRIEPINWRVNNKIKQRGPLVERCDGETLPVGLL